MAKFISDEEMQALESRQPKRMISDEDMANAEKLEETQKSSTIGDAVRVLGARGATLGARPLLAGLGAGTGAALSMLSHYDAPLGEKLKESGKAFSEEFSKGRQDAVAEQDALSEAYPKTALASEIAGGLLVPGLGAAKGIKGLAKLGLATGTGQALGEARTAKEAVKMLGLNTGSSIAGGKIGQALGSGLGKASKAIKLKAAEMAFNSLRGSLKDVKRALSKGQVEEIGRNLLDDKVIRNVPSSLETIAERITASKKNAGTRLGALVEELNAMDPSTAKVTRKEIGNAVRGDIKIAKDLPGATKKNSTIEDLLEEFELAGESPIPRKLSVSGSEVGSGTTKKVAKSGLTVTGSEVAPGSTKIVNVPGQTYSAPEMVAPNMRPERSANSLVGTLKSESTTPLSNRAPGKQTVNTPGFEQEIDIPGSKKSITREIDPFVDQVTGKRLSNADEVLDIDGALKRVSKQIEPDVDLITGKPIKKASKEISLKDAQELKNKLREEAKFDKFRGPDAVVPPEVEVSRSLYRKMNEIMDSKAEQIAKNSGKPGMSDSLKNLRKKYELTRASDIMATDRIGRDANNRLISPSDYAVGLVGAGAGLAQGDSPEEKLKGALVGLLAGAANQGVRKYGSQIAAKQLDNTANILDPAVQKLLKSSAKTGARSNAQNERLIAVRQLLGGQ